MCSLDGKEGRTTKWPVCSVGKFFQINNVKGAYALRNFRNNREI